MERHLLTGKMHSQGFTYIGVMFAVAILGTTLAVIGAIWKTIQQREDEVELLFIGNQFRNAIMQYYERTPSANKEYPKSLNQLVLDDRFPIAQKYLRKIYHDPITRTTSWGLVMTPDGRIKGVYSVSNKEPKKIKGFDEKFKDLEGAKHYHDWKFVYAPGYVIPQPNRP
jgi:type II secretory pathway pseudopilin PulG